MTSQKAKLPWEKPDAYAFFCLGQCLMSLALHPGFSDLWGSSPALSSTPTLGFFLFFWIHEHPVFLFTHMWLTYRTPCQVTLHIPREAEDFLRGDRHFKHAPLPTYLVCYHQKVYTGRFYLRLSSATICEESALREVRTRILKVS